MISGFRIDNHGFFGPIRSMSDIAPHTAEQVTDTAAATAPETLTPVSEQTATDADAQGASTDQPRSPRRPGGRADRDGRGQRRGPARAGQDKKKGPARPAAPTHPVLVRLAELEPTLFGGEAIPLKRGIFHDLVAAHPGVFEKEDLKTALALYTRSTRYLNAMGSGQQRHDLAGNAVEAVAPEHQYHATLESFRRRHARTGEDVRQKVYARILQLADASGLSPSDYAALVRSKDAAANEILDAAMEELGSRVAREEALLRAFDASGKTVNDFADAYGLHPIEAAATLTRARTRVQTMAERAAATAAEAAATAMAAETEAAATTSTGEATDDTPPPADADTAADPTAA